MMLVLKQVLIVYMSCRSVYAQLSRYLTMSIYIYIQDSDNAKNKVSLYDRKCLAQ